MQQDNLQVPPQRLVPLKRLEKALEIPSPKPIKVLPLNDLQKHTRPVHHMLGKDLQQIAALIEINENIVFLECIDVLGDGHVCGREARSHVRIVGFWDRQEIDPPLVRFSTAVMMLGVRKAICWQPGPL